MAESAQRFADRVAVVTGAASGIGRATALLLAREGARLALLDRNGDGAEHTAAAIRSAGGEARAYACNVADSSAVRAGGRMGRRTRSTVFPGWESMVMRPPWRSTTVRRAMSRPRPVPLPASLVV